MNRREFIKYSAVGICGLHLPISMIPEKKNAFIDYAVENFKVRHYKKGIIPFETHKHHAELADLYDNNRFVLVKKYRQGGFTTMSVLYGLYECITKPGTRVLMLSKTDREAQSLKEILDVAYGHMPNKPDFLRNNSYNLQLANGSSFTMMEPHACCGVSTNLIIFDECAFMEDLDRHFKALYPCASTGGKIFMVSTPNRPKGYFYELYKKALNGENKFVVYSPLCFEHPWYTPENVDMLRNNLGEKGFKQECLALFQDEPYLSHEQ